MYTHTHILAYATLDVHTYVQYVYCVAFIAVPPFPFNVHTHVHTSIICML